MGNIINLLNKGSLMIHQLPFMQIQKEGRSYILLLPFNAPFDEAHAVMSEFANEILEEQRIRKEAVDKVQAEQQQKAEEPAVG